MTLLWAKMGKSLLEFVFTEAINPIIACVVLEQAEGIYSPVSCLMVSSRCLGLLRHKTGNPSWV